MITNIITNVFGAVNPQVSTNFTLYEIEKSNTAAKYKLNNKIPDKYMDNAIRLIKTVLQPIRTAWGKPINISSGYRSLKVNQKVGGAKNSDHLFAAAADIKPSNGDTKGLWDVIIKLKDEGKINCRQIIWEYGTDKAPRWIHVSVNHPDNSEKNNQIVFVGV